TDNQEKDEKQSQNDKTGLGMEKTVKDKAKSKPESKAEWRQYPAKICTATIMDSISTKHSSSKDSLDARIKSLRKEEKKDVKDPGNEDSEVPSTEEPRVNQEKDANVNSTNNINTNVYSYDGEDVNAEADMNNLDAFILTRRMTKKLEEHGLFSSVQQRTNHKDFQNCLFACFLSQVEPKKVIQALTDPMVYRNKKDERCIMIRNKARLVAHGYTHEEGIYYYEVFAPVARIEAIRLFLAYASFKDFVVYQMDIKSAFLYGKIEEEVYRGQINKTLFIKKVKGDILLVQVYVDDIIFGSTKKVLCTEFEKLMHKKFQMNSMGELTFFLEMQVTQRDNGIFISQDKYVTKILKKFGFSDVKTASTPMETHKPVLKDADGEDVDEHLNRSMIRSLMYLTSSRPNIMFSVCACVRYQVNPKASHLYAVKRIFRYLKGQPKLSLWYPKESPFDLVAYTDNDYAGASLDRKSTTGGYQFI
ncbi:putative ribonuclease H-like domain-containing protein, partial [Tanacetum coccineum]